MPGSYSADLRERVVEAVNAGTSRRRASTVFKVGVSTAIRWAQRFKVTGSFQAKPSGGDLRSRAIEAHKDWLLALVYPDSLRIRKDPLPNGGNPILRFA